MFLLCYPCCEMSSGENAASLRLELQSQEAIGPRSAVAELSAGAENVERAPQSDLSMGTARVTFPYYTIVHMIRIFEQRHVSCGS